MLVGTFHRNHRSYFTSAILNLCFVISCSFRYAMHELGLSSKKPFKKCARVVGEVKFLFNHFFGKDRFIVGYFRCILCNSGNVIEHCC